LINKRKNTNVPREPNQDQFRLYPPVNLTLTPSKAPQHAPQEIPCIQKRPETIKQGIRKYFLEVGSVTVDPVNLKKNA